MIIVRNHALTNWKAMLLLMTQFVRAAETTFEGHYPEASQQAHEAAGDALTSVNLADSSLALLRGDVGILQALPTWQSLQDTGLTQPQNEQEVAQLGQQISQALQDAGYVFAVVRSKESTAHPGTWELWISAGLQGTIRLQGNNYYTAKQILQMMHWNSGSAFNYKDLFGHLYQINRRSYLEVESELQPREEDGQRVIDAVFTVKEGFPGNLSWSLSNDGGEQTSEWRSRVQALVTNLFKQDGTLKGSWLTDPTNVNTVNSFSGSYAVSFGEWLDAVAYGGYSESNFNEIQPQIDLFGRGYYAGWAATSVIWHAEKFALNASLGWMFLNSESTSDLSGTVFSDTNTQLSMPRLTLSYVPDDYDCWGGKTYISNTIIANWADFAGSSDAEKFDQRDSRVDGTFVLDRFELSRFQKLWGNPGNSGAWSAFANVAAQLTNEALPSSMRKSLGGFDSVRGYRERQVAGDYGYRASIELRTPLLTNFVPGLEREQTFLQEHPHYWGQHRLQFITFADAGQVQLHKPSSGQVKSNELYSVGIGLRAGLTTYSQFSFDLGFPLKNLPNSNSNNPRIHLALEMSY